MLSKSPQSRSLLIVGICAPLALLLGYVLAEPLALSSLGIVLLVLLLLSFPLLLHWHYPLLVFCWNATLIFFFLPGQPPLWAVIACLSLFISLLDRTVTKTKQSTFLRVPSVEWPLLLLAVVVIVTLYFRGGIGGRALGTEDWGGKRYIGVLAAIIGYFAFIARPIAPQRAALFAGVFFSRA